MIFMQTSPTFHNTWEFAQVQLIKGTSGGLYLTYMTNETPCKTYKVKSSLMLDSQELDPPVFQLLAQMGAQSWDIIQHSPPNYLLKHPLNLPKTTLKDLDLVEHFVK